MTLSSAELDAGLARAFGVELDTSAWLPGADPEPEALLRAAEQIGQAIGDRRSIAAPATEPAWTALPVRPDAPPSPDERAAAIARVLAWARAGGASWDGIECHVAADGNAAVRANRPLSPGEAILTLPRRLMIVDNELASSRTGKLGLDASRPRDALAAWLPLEAREPASPWRAYLDALPVQLPELPMFHTADELAALAGTAAYANAAADNRDVLDSYAGLAPELRARLSLADFAWGCAIVKSRGFHAPGTLDHRIALFPIVDFFNHRIGDTTWTYDPTDGNFVITTERAFASGDEVHLTYGDRSNARLFVHYGFTVPGNAGEAELLFERSPDPVNDIAAHLLWKLPLEARVRMRVACSLDHRFVGALSLARLKAAGPEERARGAEGGLAPYGDMPWLGGALEDAAFDVMADAARRALVRLGEPPPAARSSWEQVCGGVRAAEREVLEQILEMTSAVRAYLHGQDPVQLRAAAAAIPEDAAGARGLLRQYLRALASALPG